MQTIMITIQIDDAQAGNVLQLDAEIKKLIVAYPRTRYTISLQETFGIAIPEKPVEKGK